MDMHLERCRDQPSKSLDEFYREAAEGDGGEGGKAMMDLIARLRGLPDETIVYGLTSLHRLCLLASDTSKSPWFVILAASDKRNYFVEYLLPANLAPWPHAYVTGEAHSEDEAVQMTITAMERSAGWSKRREGLAER